MIQNFNPHDRRMLEFPAVRPCESVSPSALLSSLLNLAHTICNFQSNPFSSQRRNARTIIRRVTILRIFFEELRDHDSTITTILNRRTLSDIHVALQKIQFLLEDCTREGARVWILMKSEFVANQFRELGGVIGTALDVLPLDLLHDVTDEVKELIDLVKKQSRKSRLNADVNDECVMERVIFVIDQLENKSEPEKSSIKRVLDYLEIRTWSDCDREVRFLEEGMDSNYSNDESEVRLLGSLIALMSYCRGVAFEELDNDRILDQSGTTGANTMEVFRCLNHEDFRCPISLELMKDPVTISTGQTYDRASIHKWFKSGNMICPKTGEKLTTNELVPNTALKTLIQRFCSENGVSLSPKSKSSNRDISRTVLPSCPAAGVAIRFLAEFLAGRLTYGAEDQKNKAAYEIGLLAKSNIYNRVILTEVGVIPPLLDLLTRTDPIIQLNGITALFKLSKNKNGMKSIMASGGQTRIIHVLINGAKIESRYTAAAIIFYLASVEKYRKSIGSTPETIPALMGLIKDGTVYGKKSAIAAIFALLTYHRNRERALMVGIVPLLVELVEENKNENASLTIDSLAGLAALAETVDGTTAVLQTSCLKVVTGILVSPASPVAAKEQCCSILLGLCHSTGMEILSLLAKDCAVMGPLYGLITDGNPEARNKARRLINMLLAYHESASSSSRLSASSINKERPAFVAPQIRMERR